MKHIIFTLLFACSCQTYSGSGLIDQEGLSNKIIDLEKRIEILESRPYINNAECPDNIWEIKFTNPACR